MKIWVIIFGIIAFLGIGYAVYSKIIQPSETYRAREQTYHTNEPHFGFMSFGCAKYQVQSEKK